MTEEHITLDHNSYRTEKCYAAGEAWEELGKYLQDNIKELHWIGFRHKPEVFSEYYHDEQKTKYQGFVRFFTMPKPFMEDSNTFNIPNIDVE